MYTGSIYGIFNILDNKKYVGQTIRPYEDRWNDHIHELNNNRHHNSHLQSAWNKYGNQCFMFIVLETIEANTQEELQNNLNELEKQYIKEWNLLNDNYGYNIAEGGSNGNVLAGFTQEQLNQWKEHNSTSKKLMWANRTEKDIENFKIKCSQSTKQYWDNMTYEKREERRRKNSEAQKGKTLSKETKNKISEASKHRWDNMTQEKKNKLSRKTSEALKGKPKSEEHKRKLSETKKQQYANGYLNPNSKPVIMLNKDNKPLAMFYCIKDASQYLDKSNTTSISNCCKYKQSFAYGYIFRYLTIQEL